VKDVKQQTEGKDVLF